MELHAQHSVNGQTLTMICKNMAGTSVAETSKAPSTAPTWRPGTSEMLAWNTRDTIYSSHFCLVGTLANCRPGDQKGLLRDQDRVLQVQLPQRSKPSLISFPWANGLPAASASEERHLHRQYENLGDNADAGAPWWNRSGSSEPRERGRVRVPDYEAQFVRDRLILKQQTHK